MKFYPGNRVRISAQYHWARGATGIITEPPASVTRSVEWHGWYHYVQGTNGLIEFYWVNFDEAQIDADGDGPYTGGEIEAGMIELLT